MATLDIGFNKLKQELNQPDLTIEELENILFDFGLELDAYNEEEDLLKIDVTAERVDLLSFHGFLRALKSYLGKEKYSPLIPKKSDYQVNIDKSVDEYGNYTVCAIVKNLNLNSNKIKEIINIQEKLHVTYGRKRKSVAIGIYPLDKISFPISFKADSPKNIKFVPLGETKEMTGEEIVKNHPTGIEYFPLIKDKSKYLYFIDSKNQILSMPPVINSEAVGKVTEQTKDLFIECTGQNLYKLEHTIAILSELFNDLGGEVHSLTLNYSDKKLVTPKTENNNFTISLKNANLVLGTDFDVDSSLLLLEKMMLIPEKIDSDKIKVTVPNFRADILHDYDIYDDLARAYGFNNIKPRDPRVVSVAEKTELTVKQDDIIRTMTQMGFQEILPLTLSSEKESFDNFNIDKSKQDYIKLGVSVESSLNMVGNWLTPKLLKTLINNQHKSFPQKIFSCDYIVKENKDKKENSENILHTSCMIANSKVSFTQISSVLLSLCNILNRKLELKREDYPYYMKGRSATVIIDGKNAGTIGELAPQVLLNNSYTNPVCCFEVKL